MYCDELHWECTFNDLGNSLINIETMCLCDHVVIPASVSLNLTPCLSHRPCQDDHYYFLPPCPFDLTRPNVTFLVFAFVSSLVRTASSTAGDPSACFTSFLGVLNLFGSTRSRRLVTQTHSTILGTSQRSLAGGKTELTLTDDEWRVWFWLFAVYSYGLNQLFASCPSPWNMHTHVAHSAQCCHLHVGSTPITWP